MSSQKQVSMMMWYTERCKSTGTVLYTEKIIEKQLLTLIKRNAFKGLQVKGLCLAFYKLCKNIICISKETWK